jgi:hypothetical protein
MFLHSLNGHLLPVENARSQSRFHIGLFKNLREVFDLGEDKLRSLSEFFIVNCSAWSKFPYKHFLVEAISIQIIPI